jgi:antitoxin component YwqK of YwqJK toxin-antitoxin module
MHKIILLFALTFVLIGWSNIKEVNADNIVTRNDISYEVNSDKPFTGVVFANYKKEPQLIPSMENKTEPKKEYATQFKDGLKNGRDTSYYRNGQIYSEGNYTKGNYDGEWKEYLENGQVHII